MDGQCYGAEYPIGRALLVVLILTARREGAVSVLDGVECVIGAAGKQFADFVQRERGDVGVAMASLITDGPFLSIGVSPV